MTLGRPDFEMEQLSGKSNLDNKTDKWFTKYFIIVVFCSINAYIFIHIGAFFGPINNPQKPKMHKWSQWYTL